MVANPVIQYGVDFVVGVVAPKNIAKVLLTVNKPLAISETLLKQFNKQLVNMTPLVAKSIKANLGWADILTPLTLINGALKNIIRTYGLAINTTTAELNTFIPRIQAAFNVRAAQASVLALRPQIVSLVQLTHQLGLGWRGVTDLVVDGTIATNNATDEYIPLATAAAKYVKSASGIRDVADATARAAKATNTNAAQYVQTTEAVAKLVTSTRLAGNEVTQFTEGMTALSHKLPVTNDYLIEFVQNNAALVRSNQLSVQQLTGYGAAFEQLGVGSGEATTALNRLVTVLGSPGSLSPEKTEALNKLGFTAEGLATTLAEPNGLNNAITMLLERVQGLANTDVTVASNILTELVGGTTGTGTQDVLALATNLGLVSQAMSLANDQAANSKLTEELIDITNQADPVARLQQAFTNLTLAWGSAVQPVIVTLSKQLAGIVERITAFVQSIRPIIQGLVVGLVNVSVGLSLILDVIKPLILTWTTLNTVIGATNLIAVGLNKLSIRLLSAGFLRLGLAVEAVEVAMSRFHKFLASTLLPGLINLAKNVLGAKVVKAIEVIPEALGGITRSIVKLDLKGVIANSKALYAALVGLLPTLFAIAGAYLAVRLAMRTWNNTLAESNKIRASIEEIGKTGDETAKALERMGIAADGTTVQTKSLWDNIVSGADATLEFVRDNISIFEHIGRAFNISQLESIRFATSAEASANQARIAYGDLLATIDSYGASYQTLTDKLQSNPTDAKALEAGEQMITLLRQQKKALEDVAVAKEDEASKAVYVKSLDQQIRYLTKLTVGNDELKNSLDQAEVSVENMAQALDNLRSKVSEEVSKAAQEEIEQLQEAHQVREEGYKAEVEGVKEVAQEQYDEREQLITRQEQLEDRAIDRSRQLEDRAIEDSIEAREAAISKREAAEDKAIERRQAAEDKAIANREAAEDRAIERRQAAEDKAIERRQAAEDKAIERKQEAELAAIEAASEAAIDAIDTQLDQRVDAIESATELELAQIDARLAKELAAYDRLATQREQQLESELAKREQIAQIKSDEKISNKELQQAQQIQQLELQFEQQQQQRDLAYERTKQQQEAQHQARLQQLDATYQTRKQAIESNFNQQQLDQQLKAVDARKTKELDSISAQEQAELKRFELEQQLANATPEERARIEREAQAAEQIEQRKQAIRDKYEQQRQQAEQAAEQAQAAIEAQKAKEEAAKAAALAKLEEQQKAAQAKLEEEAAAQAEALRLQKEQEDNARKTAFEEQLALKRQENEAVLNELRLQQEEALQVIRQENEAKLEELRQQAEAERRALELKAEEEKEERRRVAEEKIQQLRLEAQEKQEQLRLQTEEQLQAKRDEYEALRLQREEQRELEKAKREEQRELEKAKREEQRELEKAKLQEQREQQAEQKEEQREQARKARQRRDEDEAYARQIKREDEDYARQLEREEELEARRKQFEEEQARRDEEYEIQKAEREKALAEQIAERERELAQELEIIKLQTQESIEQSYSSIVAGLNASAAAIAAAARQANSAAGGGGGASGRYKGGRVMRGVPYWVGENRHTGALTPDSELFIPNQAGYVASASQVWSMIRAANRLASPPPVARLRDNVVTQDSLTKQLAPMAKELRSINRRVAAITNTVNPRTNELRVGSKPNQPTVYRIN